MLSAAVNIQKSKYGDFVITSNGSGVLPPTYSLDDRIIFKNYKETPKGTKFLCDSRVHGILYATQPMVDIFPAFDREHLCYSLAVPFIDQRYVVLVKLKGIRWVLCPSGARNSDESFKDAATREALEEADINITNLRKLAMIRRKTEFGGLKFNSFNTCYMADTEAHPDWPDLNTQSVTYIPVRDNSETEQIVVVDMHDMDYLVANKKLNICTSHLRIIREAYARMHTCDSLISLKFAD